MRAPHSHSHHPHTQQLKKYDDSLHAGAAVSDHFLGGIQRIKDDELNVVVIGNWPRVEPVWRGARWLDCVV